jgi:hypothetical protein
MRLNHIGAARVLQDDAGRRRQKPRTIAMQMLYQYMGNFSEDGTRLNATKCSGEAFYWEGGAFPALTVPTCAVQSLWEIIRGK